MAHIKRIISIIIAMFLTIFMIGNVAEAKPSKDDIFFSGQVNAEVVYPLEDPNNGGQVRLNGYTYNADIEKENIFCIQQGFALANNFTTNVVSVIEIRKDGFYVNGEKHDYGDNAETMFQWAWILNQDGEHSTTQYISGQAHYSIKQVAIWENIANVMNIAYPYGAPFGYSSSAGERGFTSEGRYDFNERVDEYNGLISDAQDYASKVINALNAEESSGTSKVRSLINKANIKVSTYENNNNYIKVGPFKYSVDSGTTITDAYLTDGNENRINNLQYGYYSGSTFITSYSYQNVIKNNQEFYVMIPKTAGVKELGNFKVSYSYKESTDISYFINATMYIMQSEGSNQNLLFEKTSEEPLPPVDKNGSDDFELNIKLTGKLKIVKLDGDTNSPIAGAQFSMTSTSTGQSETATTNNRGILEVDLLPGTYRIKEIGAANGYKIELQDEAIINGTETATVEVAETTTKTYYNYKYGDLKIYKVDKAEYQANKTGKPLYTLSDTEKGTIIFKDVGFRISYVKNGVTYYIKDYRERTNRPSEITETTNANSAKIFKTDGNAQIILRNLRQVYKYYVEEVSLPSDMQMYYDVNTQKSSAITLSSNYDGTITEYYALNEQVRVDLAGYVWEDVTNGKTSKRNDLYNSSDGDIRIPGITVYLKKNGNTIATTTTDKNGEYFFAAKGTGYTINIKELSQYFVEFEYNGLRYQNVVVNKTASNGSKAKETDTNRNTLNSNYNTIYGATQKSSSGTTGKTGTNVNLRYTAKNSYQSELVNNTHYTSSSVQNSTDVEKAKMFADTKTANYVIAWSAGTRVIRGINLGIYERAQPDLAIVTDIDNVKLSVNGYNHTYKYGQRAPYANDDVVSDSLDGFSVKVKNGNGTYKNMTYTRDFDETYISYAKDNTVKVYVTYKLVIKNESSSLKQKVALVTYADSRFKMVSSTVNGTDIKSKWSDKGSVESGVNKYESEQLDNMINPGKSIDVYITYEVSSEVLSNMSNWTNGNKLELKDYITEILSYSTYDSNGSKYGGVDIDSAPNNIKYATTSTYEDDTDVAPGFALNRKNPRQIEGLVFEDATSKDLKTKTERKGNSVYDSGEKGITNLEVRLMDYKTGQVAKLYKMNGMTVKDPEDAITITDSSGNYLFEGIVPGEYYIQYTYGTFTYNDQTKQSSFIDSSNNTIKVTTESYKSTIINENKFKTLVEDINDTSTDVVPNKKNYSEISSKNLWYWYQENSNYSSAVDNVQRRNNINNNLKEIDYGVKTRYENNTDGKDIHSIDAYTGIMDVPIEEKREQVTEYDYTTKDKYSIKFGIVERARVSIQINKEVSHVSIRLANGQLLIDGDPRSERLNYVTYPSGGPLKIEVDNEIIEGATLDIEYEISVTNNSELDYDNIKYYRYGNNSGLKPSTIELKSFVDYADEKLSLSYDIGNSSGNIEYYDGTLDTSKWYLLRTNGFTNTEDTYKMAGIEIDGSVYSKIKGRDNVAIRQLGGNDYTLAPGSSTSKLKLTAKKLVSNLNQTDQTFDNYVELLQLSNPLGRFYVKNSSTTETATPGNFNIYAVDNTTECDDNGNARRAKTVIIPPTGVKDIIIYTSIGVCILTVIAVGIIFIKKRMK